MSENLEGRNIQDVFLDVVRKGDLKKIGSMLREVGVDSTAGSLAPTALHIAATGVCVRASV